MAAQYWSMSHTAQKPALHYGPGGGNINTYIAISSLTILQGSVPYDSHLTYEYTEEHGDRGP